MRHFARWSFSKVKEIFRTKQPFAFRLKVKSTNVAEGTDCRSWNHILTRKNFKEIVLYISNQSSTCRTHQKKIKETLKSSQPELLYKIEPNIHIWNSFFG